MNTEPVFNKIVLSTTDGYYPISPEEIIYCEGDDSYTHLYLQNGKCYTVCKLLKEYEQLLAPYNFFRIHKSYLVNINQIEMVTKADSVSVTMSNKTALPVSYRKKEGFISKILSL